LVVAQAIEDHYKPRFSGDDLPRDRVGSIVALADKIELLVGMFAVGELPTGDKDPFGLRRAAVGVVRIASEQSLPIDLQGIVAGSADSFHKGKLSAEGKARMHERWDLRGVGSAAYMTNSVAVPEEARAALMRFVSDRFGVVLKEQGYSAQEVDAVFSVGPRLLSEVPLRLAAVRTFAALPESASLAAANKRIANILKKSDSKPAEHVDPSRLVEPAERTLHDALLAIAPRADERFGEGEYTASLRELAALKAPVDAFFDGVMVNADDPALRANRLALLARLHQSMNRVADLSKLAA
jgi:glycyl-tRNA synthetase beta chain